MTFERGDTLVLVDKHKNAEVHYLVVFQRYVSGGAVVTYIGTEQNFDMMVAVDSLHVYRGTRNKEKE